MNSQNPPKFRRAFTTNFEETPKPNLVRGESMASFIRTLNSRRSLNKTPEPVRPEPKELPPPPPPPQLPKSIPEEEIDPPKAIQEPVPKVPKKPFSLPVRDINLCKDPLPITSINDYSVGKEIGKGAYASVKKAVYRPTGMKVAIKFYDKQKLFDPQRKKNVNREIQVLKKIDHPNIVKLIETIDTAKSLVLVMHLISGQNLHSYLKYKKNLDEGEAHLIFRSVAEAIAYCHSIHVCHRDIKLENILLNSHKQPTLIDFGFATCVPHEKKFKLFCGTPSYMAPEIIMKGEYSGAPADVWALGVLLFVMVVGQFPFKGYDDRELYRKIQRGFFILPQHLSPSLRELLSSMIRVDTQARANINQVMESSWVINGPDEGYLN